MELFILIGLVLLNGAFAMSELAVVSSRRSRLQAAAERGAKGAKAALALQDDPSRFLSTVQIGITLVGIVAGAYGATALADDLAPALATAAPPIAAQADEIAFAVVIILTTYLSLVIGELVPKRVALSAPERIAGLVARPMSLLSRAALPAVWFLQISTEALLRIAGMSGRREDAVTEDEIHSIIEEGATSGAIDLEERQMLRGVMRLADRDVRSIMTPRPDIVWLDATASPEATLRRIAESRHSRFPVARGDLEHILGVVQTKDLLVRGAEELQAAVHPAIFVPETLSVMKLLAAMQGGSVRMAIVVDELGSVEGIVTAADLLGAVAGSGAFSAEDALDAPVRRTDGSWLIDGLTAIEDLEVVIGARGLAGEGDYATVAGLLMHHLQRLPQAGDGVAAHGFWIEVVDMDGRRIDKVLVRRVEEEG